MSFRQRRRQHPTLAVPRESHLLRLRVHQATAPWSHNGAHHAGEATLAPNAVLRRARSDQTQLQGHTHATTSCGLIREHVARRRTALM